MSAKRAPKIAVRASPDAAHVAAKGAVSFPSCPVFSAGAAGWEAAGMGASGEGEGAFFHPQVEY